MLADSHHALSWPPCSSQHRLARTAAAQNRTFSCAYDTADDRLRIAAQIFDDKLKELSAAR